VRAPASYCGIYGIRPTHGRVSLEGACPLAPSFDTAGWFARDAALLERVGQALLGEERAGKPGRLIIAEDAFQLSGAAVSDALQPALERLRDVLGPSQRVTVSAEGLPQWFQVFRVLQGAEVWAQHETWINRVKPLLGPGIKERIDWASTLTARDVGPAKSKREDIARRMAELLAGNAVLALPTLPGIAPLLNTPPAELEDFRGRAMSLLCIAGLARLPQIILPVARLDGCPLGLSLVASRGGDSMLLALAKAL
ncbi:MAG TPA: amidase family protein, partial [Burkholderiales bacterium]|nr:amidase family protein [Burkholderiales bacterium]